MLRYRIILSLAVTCLVYPSMLAESREAMEYVEEWEEKRTEIDEQTLNQVDTYAKKMMANIDFELRLKQIEGGKQLDISYWTLLDYIDRFDEIIRGAPKRFAGATLEAIRKSFNSKIVATETDKIRGLYDQLIYQPCKAYRSAGGVFEKAKSDSDLNRSQLVFGFRSDWISFTLCNLVDERLSDSMLTEMVNYDKKWNSSLYEN